jgi:hypothetical protein
MKNTLLLVLTLSAGNAFAQAQAPAAVPSAAPAVQVDARFAAWIGCWRLEDDLAGTGARMCITPEPRGVRLQTIVGTNKGIDEVVIPDAVAHPITDAECKGTERAEFSSDGQRVFRTTDVTCGQEAPRTIKSVAFLAAGPVWINVQQVSGAAATTSVRVQRYRRAVNQLLADGSKAPQPASSVLANLANIDTTWSVEDVIEAGSKVPAEALQASLTELKQGFSLNRQNLIALDDAGIQDQVIDLMVALSYPKRYVVQRVGGGGSTTGLTTGGGWFDPFMTPMLMGHMMSDCFTPFGYGYRSYYSMCGNMMGYSGFYDYGYNYNRFGGYGYPNYGGYGGWVDVGGLPTGGGSITPQAEGRVVNGRGYTQIRDRDAEPSPRTNGGMGNGGAWSGAGGNSGGASTSGYSSGSASGASSGGGGSSSGGDSGARVAVPKGGGGQ